MDKLFKVDPIREVIEQAVCKFLNLAIVFRLLVDQLHSGESCLLWHERQSFSVGKCQRDVLQDELDFFFLDELVSVLVVAPEGNEHFLVERTHEEVEEESNELVMVDSFVTVGIDLVDHSLPNQQRKVQV